MSKQRIIGGIIGIICIIIIGLLIRINATSIENTAQEGDSISIIYEAKLPDTRIFQSSNGEVIQITIGENIIPGLDKNLIGAQSGDMLSFNVPASEGYDKYYDPSKVQKIPVYTLQQAGIIPEKDKTILLGTQITTVKSIDNDTVTLDNNPLYTRQDLYYTVYVAGLTK